MPTPTYYLDKRVIRTTEDPGFGDLINSINLTQFVTELVTSLGSSGSTNVLSPIKGNGSVADPLTFIDGTVSGQVIQWNGSNWVLNSGPSTTFFGLTDTPATAAVGQMYYSNGITVVSLGLGGALEQLRVNAAGTAPEWFIGGDTSITSGTLAVASSGRTVDLGTNTLTFDNVTTYLLNATSYYLGNGTGTNKPTLDSDAVGEDVLSLDANGQLGRINSSKFENITGVVAPTNDVTTAWYIGQLYYDNFNNALYTATAKSTNPDTSPIGSVWTSVLISDTSITNGTVPVASTPRVMDFNSNSLDFINLTNFTTVDTGNTSISSVVSTLTGSTSSSIVSGSNSLINNGLNIVSSIGNTAGSFIVGTNADPVTNISVPLQGMISYDTTDEELQAYIGGTGWVNLSKDNFVTGDLQSIAPRIHTFNHDLTINGTGTKAISDSVAGRLAYLQVDQSAASVFYCSDGVNSAEVNLNSGGSLALDSTSQNYQLTTAPPIDSDSNNYLLARHTSIGQIQMTSQDSLRTLNSAADPVDDVDVSWFVGQLRLNNTTNDLFRATGKSLNPDGGPVGSIWQLVGKVLKNYHLNLYDISADSKTFLEIIAATATTAWGTIVPATQRIDLSTPTRTVNDGFTVNTKDITIDNDGIYKIEVGLIMPLKAAGGEAFAQLCHNGTTVLDVSSVSGNLNGYANHSLTAIVDLTATDTIDVRIDMSAAGSSFLYKYSISITRIA